MSIPGAGKAYGAMQSLGSSFLGTPARKILEASVGKDEMKKETLKGTAGIMTTLAGVAAADHVYNSDFFM